MIILGSIAIFLFGLTSIAYSFVIIKEAFYYGSWFPEVFFIIGFFFMGLFFILIPFKIESIITNL